MNTQIIAKKFFPRLILGLILALALLEPLAGPPQSARADATFWVDVNYDAHDFAPGNGVCADTVGNCPLRAAIEEAFATAGSKTIQFSIIGTFNVSLGSLTIAGDNITIDASSAGAAVIINGGGLPGNSNIFDIGGNSNTLKGLTIVGWPDVRTPDDDHGHGIRIHDLTGSGLASYNTLDSLIVYGMEHSGVYVQGDAGGGGTNNTISHSLIGAANWASTTCVSGSENKWHGIHIAEGADNTDINSNHIVCNLSGGILIDGSTGGQISGTIIQTNLIGTDGTHNMGNGSSGIFDNGATGTQIYNNVISSNAGSGVWLQGSTNAIVTTNRIGTNAAGNTALANGQDGVTILANANGNTLGSDSDANGRNIISGNHLCGVEIITGAYNNGLIGNYIGLGADGSTPIPNGEAGVAIKGATNNALSSGLGTDPAQFISGNTREGVYVENAERAIINWRTYIGVASDMTTARPNGMEGVMLNGATNAIIRPGAVVNNGGAGIAVVGDTAAGDSLLPLKVSNNGGLPIDLGNDGPTANDLGDGDTGPNGLLNYPELNMTVPGGITGMTCPGCNVYIYQASGDPRAAGGGGTYITGITADLTTGDFAYTFPAGVASVSLIACQPISPSGCSEMSPAYSGGALPLTYSLYLPIVLK